MTEILLKIFKNLWKLYWNPVYKLYKMKYSVKSNFRFAGKDIDLYGDGKIVLGNNSYIGGHSIIQSVKDQKVVIGDNCSISHNVKIYTSNFVTDDVISGNKNPKYSKGDVIIGNNCWIGSGVFIKENVKIGNFVVIGANSVVTRDVPDNSLVAGCPAKIIRFYDKKTRKIKKPEK